MITEFPHFSRLDLTHKQYIEELTYKYDSFSDFNFTSLFCWDVDGSTEVSLLNDNLVIKLSDYINGEDIYSILGINNIDDSLGKLLVLTDHLKLVPEIVIQSLNDNKKFKIIEDRDNFDYIVSSSEIAELDPTKYPKKNNMIKEIKLKHPDLKVKKIDLTNPGSKNLILNMVDTWRRLNNKNDEDVEKERTAITRLLDYSQYFSSLYALGIYDNEDLVAFNTYEIAMENYGISSFQKGNKKYENIYALLTQELAKNMLALGCEYINFEQDLGIMGLRNSKLSYHPKKFLKKYTVSLASN